MKTLKDFSLRNFEMNKQIKEPCFGTRIDQNNCHKSKSIIFNFASRKRSYFRSHQFMINSHSCFLNSKELLFQSYLKTLVFFMFSGKEITSPDYFCLKNPEHYKRNERFTSVSKFNIVAFRLQMFSSLDVNENRQNWMPWYAWIQTNKFEFI